MDIFLEVLSCHDFYPVNFFQNDLHVTGRTQIMLGSHNLWPICFVKPVEYRTVIDSTVC